MKNTDYRNIQGILDTIDSLTHSADEFKKMQEEIKKERGEGRITFTYQREDQRDNIVKKDNRTNIIRIYKVV